MTNLQVFTQSLGHKIGLMTMLVFLLILLWLANLLCGEG